MDQIRRSVSGNPQQTLHRSLLRNSSGSYPLIHLGRSALFIGFGQIWWTEVSLVPILASQDTPFTRNLGPFTQKANDQPQGAQAQLVLLVSSPRGMKLAQNGNYKCGRYFRALPVSRYYLFTIPHPCEYYLVSTSDRKHRIKTRPFI